MINRTVEPQVVRCAIYTRKSTEEGLEQDFNSLDAQRESAESFILSQKEAGFVALETRYDDGGFTGGNADRPALVRLIDDIKQSKIDCVVVYKVDRLSRSLLDFSQLIELFERHKVEFVSVTQHFNTGTSMGRLILNVLLSFAQFERELISERTRDKMGAARRKGKWLGSIPVLGYGVDALQRRLIADACEAVRVQEIFRLYLELKSIASVVEELMRRSWNNKRWTTKKGNERGGNEFKRATIQFLLTNVTYIGKVKYRGELFDGEQEAIIDETVFNQVQALLAKNRTSPLGKRQKKKNKGPLVDRLFCMKCGTRMNETYTIKNNRKYRYYACLNRTGGDEVGPKCRWVPANKLEQAIFDEIWRERYSGLSAIRPKLTSSCRGKLIRKNSDKVFVDPDGNEIEIELAQFNNAADDFGWRDDCDENQNKPK